MEELLRTNDLVLISFVESVLRELDAGYFIADQAISSLDGSIGIMPRRIMIDSDDSTVVRRALREAGLGSELSQPPQGLMPW